MSKPVLLVDVDGVINAMPSFGTPAASKFNLTIAEGYRIHLHPEIERMFKVLSQHFELVWGTAWTTRANTEILPLIGGGDPWPVVDVFALGDKRNDPWRIVHGNRFSGETLRTVSWKLEAVDEHVSQEFADRPVAWIDDDLGQDVDEWADDRAKASGQPVWIERTDPAKGITWQSVTNLVAFAREVCEGR